MWDRQAISSLLTLLGGVAAAVLLIALQPDPGRDVPAPRDCVAAADSAQPACTVADARHRR